MAKQIITYIDEMFVDKNQDGYIFMESYLKCMKPHITYGINAEISLNPFLSEVTYYDANKYTLELTERMISGYGKAIGEYYRAELDKEQWIIIMLMWMRWMIIDIYYRYLKLQKYVASDVYMIALKEYPQEKYLADYMRSAYRDDLKQSYFWGKVGKKMGMEVKYALPTQVKEKNRYASYLKRVINEPQTLLKSIAYRAKSVSPKKEQEQEFHNINEHAKVLLMETLITLEKEKEFEKRSGGILQVLDSAEMMHESRKIIEKFDPDLKMREEVLAKAFKPQNAFEDVAHQLILEFLPIAYFEAFGELYKRALDITKKWEVKKIYESYASIELFDICVALMKKKGTKLCGIQHSGHYGAAKYQLLDEVARSDRFLTWGWTETGIDFVTCDVCGITMVRRPPMPSETQKKIKPSGKILMISNIALLKDFGYGMVYDDYLNNVLEFINALSDEIRQRLVLRIDPNDCINAEIMRVCHEKYPCIRYESRYEKTFTESTLESEFLICDYFSSPQMEALLLGKPFIMYEGAKIVECHPDLLKIIDKYEECGVFFRDGKKCADFLNSSKDIMSVLQSDESKKISKEFMQHFAGINKDHYESWYNEFIAL